MLLSNVAIATMESHSPYGLIKNGAIVIDGSNISWVGTLAELPTKYKKLEEIEKELEKAIDSNPFLGEQKKDSTREG